MKYRVVVSAAAEKDLLEIGLYLAEQSPGLAVAIARRLKQSGLELGDRALRYALVPRHEGAGIRRRVVRSYNIYYRITDETVIVLHILHGARDADAILSEDD